MPALPDVPQIARVDLRGSYSTDVDVLTRLYFKYSGAAPANSDAVTLASAIATAWESAKGIYPSEYFLSVITVTDLSTSSSAQGEWTGSVEGTNDAGLIAAGTAFLVNYQINRRYRGGKPRTYLPVGTTSDLSTARAWTSGFVTSVTDTWGAFITAILALPFGAASFSYQANVSYYGPPNYTKGVLPAPVKTYSTQRASALVDEIVGTTYSTIPSSQRRRNGQKR
jgi:hypothetical protein